MNHEPFDLNEVIELYLYYIEQITIGDGCFYSCWIPILRIILVCMAHHRIVADRVVFH